MSFAIQVQESEIAVWRQKPIVIDSCLVILLLFCQQGSDPKRHKRLKDYNHADYVLLCEIIRDSAGLLFTPGIFIEASNLLSGYESTTALRELILNNEETYFASRTLALHTSYERLGLTDCAILTLAKEAVLISNDTELVNHARANQIIALQFSELRHSFRWQ